MKSIAPLLLGLITALIVPAAGQMVPIKKSLAINGITRDFYYQRPSAVLTHPGVVFILHGSGAAAANVIPRAAALAARADRENVLLVYPEGYKKFWNECRKAANSTANLENIDEEAFFGAMIAYFKEHHGIDERKVFAIGTSGGGHMCYKLAITMPDRIRAIAAFIANLPDTDNMDCPDARVPMPVMVVNGTDDPLNPYQGGMMQSGDFIMGNVRSTDRTIAYWAELAGHRSAPTKEHLPDTDPSDGETIERYTYRAKGKPEIVMLKVIGGKHDLPRSIDVYLEAWAFFKRQIGAEQ